MSERTLKVPRAVRDLIRRLHPQMKRKVRAALADILKAPNSGKPLRRELEGYWSLRIGRHRIIYRPDDAGSEIAAFGPRKTIYEEMARHVISEGSGKRKNGGRHKPWRLILRPPRQDLVIDVAEEYQGVGIVDRPYKAPVA
ncbi:MAG: hypothetical protein EXQ51_04815 [Acidobacteria bacterium]|nr:hypothetical protein [Acidobacteriota bacterium]